MTPPSLQTKKTGGEARPHRSCRYRLFRCHHCCFARSPPRPQPCQAADKRVCRRAIRLAHDVSILQHECGFVGSGCWTLSRIVPAGAISDWSSSFGTVGGLCSDCDDVPDRPRRSSTDTLGYHSSNQWPFGLYESDRRRDPGVVALQARSKWRPYHRFALILSLVMLAAYIATPLAFATESEVVGLIQRTSLATFVTWFLLTAARLRSIAIGSGQG